jgi:hypothetical protein
MLLSSEIVAGKANSLVESEDYGVDVGMGFPCPYLLLRVVRALKQLGRRSLAELAE